eukprot:1197546-Rhodomonas_salina.4
MCAIPPPSECPGTTIPHLSTRYHVPTSQLPLYTHLSTSCARPGTTWYVAGHADTKRMRAG